MKSLIPIILIFLFTTFAYADWQVRGDYAVRTSKTVFTKQLGLLTEGVRPNRPLNNHYFKNPDRSITRWNRVAWEATDETVRSLTGRDEL